MRKQDKKQERALVNSLTQACEAWLEALPGFEWLTHTVDYRRFPASLMVTLIFATPEDMQHARETRYTDIVLRVAKALAEAGVSLHHPERHILFDNEIDCDQQHQGNWAARLAAH